MAYVTLLGSEQVEHAGHAMQEAAERMEHAASEIVEALTRHQRFLDEWLGRLAELLEPRTAGLKHQKDYPA